MEDEGRKDGESREVKGRKESERQEGQEGGREGRRKEGKEERTPHSNIKGEASILMARCSERQLQFLGNEKVWGTRGLMISCVCIYGKAVRGGPGRGGGSIGREAGEERPTAAASYLLFSSLPSFPSFLLSFTS